MKRIGVFAGGAAKGAYPVGVLTTKRVEYDTYIGTSTGALIALFMALGRIDSKFYDLLLHEYQNTSNREMYGILPPYDKKGDFNNTNLLLLAGKMRFRKRNYVYDISKALRAKITKHFKEYHFMELRSRKIDLIVTTKNLDLKRSKTEYTSILKDDMEFDRFVDWVVASASIPFFAKPTIINGFQRGDGGVLDPIPTALLSQYVDYKVDIWLCHSQQEEQSVLNPANDHKSLAGNLFDDMRFEIMLNDLKTMNKDVDIYYSRFYEWAAADFKPKNMRAAIMQGQHDANTITAKKL